jgi:hypothetical protein
LRRLICVCRQSKEISINNKNLKISSAKLSLAECPLLADSSHISCRLKAQIL